MIWNTYEVSMEEKGIRLDKLLSDLNKDASRTQVQFWIKDNHVKVNGNLVKNNYKCQPEDLIEWEIPDPVEVEIKPENIPLDIRYEDKHLLVVNKPKGMVVHPSAGHTSNTLVNALLYHCQDLSGINGTIRPGIVHRIDKDTSGLLVVAKDDISHELLSNQLKDKKIHRKYRAIVHGEIPHDYGTVEAPIGRDPKDRQRMAVVDGGKSAVTHFNVLERFENYTYIECQLETGRTHQIRVHMRYIGYPLAGDPKYGQRKTMEIGGQALHAYSLGFTHPVIKEFMEFEAELPDVIENVLKNLRSS